MADFKSLKSGKGKGKGMFGPPPKSGSGNLEAPEHAPATPSTTDEKDKVLRGKRGKTGRTEPFSTRVTAEFNEEFRRIGFEHKMKKVELLEACLEAYKREHGML